MPFGQFFQKFAKRRNKAKNRFFLLFWESSVNQFDQPKKKGRQFCLKIGPLEKTLDPPLYV